MSTVGQLMKIMVLAVGLCATASVEGQDQPVPKEKKPVAAAAPASPEAKEFQELFAVRTQLSAKLNKLQGPLQEAVKANDAKKHKELVDQFNAQIADFESKTLPRMLELAGPLYIKDGKYADAETIVLGHLQDLYHENKYRQVVAEGGKYYAAGRKHPLILNFVGVSLFATHDFNKAEEVLKQAKLAANNSDEAGSMFAQIGSRYLDLCKEYQGYWKTEQALRQKEAAATGEAKLPRVLFKTNRGDIELELFENEAPNSVANFISLVEKKKYDGVAFHRVLPNFMAQGGDPNTLDKDPRNDGMGGPGYHIACECYQPNARMHFQGSLSMAHAGKDSGGSQFFLTHLPTSHLNPDPDKPSGHTVFGRITKGLDLVLGLRPGDKIITATMISKRNHPYVPKTMPGD